MDFILHGDICQSADRNTIECRENAYLVCAGGVSKGVFDRIPEEFQNLPVRDFSGKLVLPGMSDLHTHAPQFSYRGLGMDLELMQWLDAYAFPEEARYADLSYADKAYTVFSDAYRKSVTTRMSVFATCHTDATLLLMDKMEKTGLVSYIGRVGMDRNAPDYIREPSAEEAAAETERWIEGCLGKYERTFPIITPRFLPSCTEEYLARLGEIREKYGLPVQSHLSENLSEIEFVRELFPDIAFYGDGYRKYGLFGGDHGCIMAHCVYSSNDEIELMKQSGVFIAHCPASNMNVSSGIAPVRKYLDGGLNMGLATDVAGGETESMFRTIVHAVQASKLRWRLCDQDVPALTFDEAFYLATVGGGKFFGKVGSFSEGYDLDAVVIDDSAVNPAGRYSLRQRLERAVYSGCDEKGLQAKFVRGSETDLA